MNQISFALTSTVVAPFTPCKLLVAALTADEFRVLCEAVTANFCGHPTTLEKLASANLELPAPQKGQFWNMKGIALAARPKGGVRGAAEVELNALDQLEFCAFIALDPQSDEEALDFHDTMQEILEEIEGFGVSGIRPDVQQWFSDVVSQCAIK